MYAEQVGLLYGYAPLAYSVTLINGLILIFVQRAHIPMAVLLSWFACLTLVTAGRIVLVYGYNRTQPPAERPTAGRGGIASGLAWRGSPGVPPPFCSFPPIPSAIRSWWPSFWPA